MRETAELCFSKINTLCPPMIKKEVLETDPLLALLSAEESDDESESSPESDSSSDEV